MSTQGSIGTDLDKTITSAVNARVEAAVAAALSGDEVIGKYVTAALAQPIEVPKRSGYGKDQVPYLTHVLGEAIRLATKVAVERLIAEEITSIEAAVRKALRRDLDRIAGTLTQSLTTAAAKTYGVDVHLDLKMPAA